MEFIKGLTLCEDFFFEIAKPILDMHFSGLIYSAGLIGYGSDVLGYDDEVSTDHMWGPRFYLFLTERDICKKQEIMKRFGNFFPFEYRGYGVNFTPYPGEAGIRCPEKITEGPVSPLIFIHTPECYLSDYIGATSVNNLTEADWLAFSEHRLLSITTGKMFIDGLGMEKTLNEFCYYPDDVRLYLIASNWSLIAEEQAFVRRCFDAGDNIGSVLACARIAERLMRLMFLYVKKYAPYSKWFGTAFSRLPIDENIKLAISRAVEAEGIIQRENNIVLAQKLIADYHNKSNITEHVDIRIENYHDRDIKVIFADKIANAVMRKLSGTVFEDYPRVGTLSGVANFTNLFDNPAYRERIKAFYR